MWCSVTIVLLQWVSDTGAATSGTPVKVENPNLFAPQGDNSKELREKVKEVPDYLPSIHDRCLVNRNYFMILTM